MLLRFPAHPPTEDGAAQDGHRISLQNLASLHTMHAHDLTVLHNTAHIAMCTGPVHLDWDLRLYITSLLPVCRLLKDFLPVPHSDKDI